MQTKKLILSIVVVLLLGLAIFLIVKYSFNEEIINEPETEIGLDPLNVSYLVEGEEIQLVNGSFEKEAAPGSASKIEVKVFGEPVLADLNEDGAEDAVLFLTYSGGGSGTFYYVAVALNGLEATNVVLLGDRIAPQSIQVEGGLIVANYATRDEGQAMTEEPTIAKTKYLQVEGLVLEDLNLKECSLDGTESKMTLEEAREISLTGGCSEEGLVGVLADCNSGTGTWWIEFTPTEVKEGCYPACVVNVETKEAEVNWRCAGLISE